MGRYGFRQGVHPDRRLGGETSRHGARGHYDSSRYGRGSAEGGGGASGYSESPAAEESGSQRGRAGTGIGGAPRVSSGPRTVRASQAPPAPRGAKTACSPSREPPGYQRSDARIEQDVCERLEGRPDLDTSKVAVEARDATVRLDGSVPERWMKDAIEDITDHCLGVNDIENEIRIETGA